MISSLKPFVGCWVIHDFKVKAVTSMEGDRVVQVSDVHFATSGYDLDVRVLTLNSLGVAQGVERIYDEMYEELVSNNNVNWPDISRYFETKCIGLIDYLEKIESRKERQDGKKYTEDEIEFIEAYWNSMKEFKEQIIGICGAQNRLSVDGVRVFRR